MKSACMICGATSSQLISFLHVSLHLDDETLPSILEQDHQGICAAELSVCKSSIAESVPQGRRDVLHPPQASYQPRYDTIR